MWRELPESTSEPGFSARLDISPGSNPIPEATEVPHVPEPQVEQRLAREGCPTTASAIQDDGSLPAKGWIVALGITVGTGFKRTTCHRQRPFDLATGGDLGAVTHIQDQG